MTCVLILNRITGKNYDIYFEVGLFFVFSGGSKFE